MSRERPKVIPSIVGKLHLSEESLLEVLVNGSQTKKVARRRRPDLPPVAGMADSLAFYYAQ